jgi:hypothetical protein
MGYDFLGREIASALLIGKKFPTKTSPKSTKIDYIVVMLEQK